jgi:hypothetical protein
MKIQSILAMHGGGGIGGLILILGVVIVLAVILNPNRKN